MIKLKPRYSFEALSNDEKIRRVELINELGQNLILDDEKLEIIINLELELCGGYPSGLGEIWNEHWEKYFPSNDDKIHLLKGLILIQIKRGEIGGYNSVTPTALIFDKIFDLGLDNQELYDWILNNKSFNFPWTPFRSIHATEVKSREDFKKYKRLVGI